MLYIWCVAHNKNIDKNREVFMKINEKNNLAFTITELLVVIAIVLFLALLFGIGSGWSRIKAQRINCVNNLKQLTLQCKLFVIDNNGRFPWQIPVNESGSFDPANQKTFRHFLTLTKGIGNPKICFCPADKNKSFAKSWAEFNNNNCSYFVGYDVDNSGGFLFGDRNLKGIANNESCNVWKGAQGGCITTSSEWDEAIHNKCGNVSFGDGSVHQVDTAGLKKLAETVNRDNGRNHSRFPID